MMIKKLICLVLLFSIAFEGFAFAADSSGEIVFMDALYGALIGAMLGGAFYIADEDATSEDLGARIGTGVAIGTLAGLAFGVVETRSTVEIKKGRASLHMPTLTVEQRGRETLYSTKLVKVHF